MSWPPAEAASTVEERRKSVSCMRYVSKLSVIGLHLHCTFVVGLATNCYDFQVLQEVLDCEKTSVNVSELFLGDPAQTRE